MKTIYNLTIEMTNDPQYPSLDVCYESMEKAMNVLSQILNTFKVKYGVPNESNEKWRISDRGNDEEHSVTVFPIGMNSECFCMFSGKIHKSFLIEDGDELKSMSNIVVAFSDHPDTLCKLESPIVEGCNFAISNIIDIKEKRRLDMPPGRSVTPTSSDMVSQYYKLNDELK